MQKACRPAAAAVGCRPSPPVPGACWFRPGALTHRGVFPGPAVIPGLLLEQRAFFVCPVKRVKSGSSSGSAAALEQLLWFWSQWELRAGIFLNHGGLSGAAAVTLLGFLLCSAHPTRGSGRPTPRVLGKPLTGALQDAWRGGQPTCAPLTAGSVRIWAPGPHQGSALILTRARATCSSGRPGTDAPPTPSAHLRAGDPPGVPQHSRPLKPRSADSWRPILDLWGPSGRDHARNTPQLTLRSQAGSAQASVPSPGPASAGAPALGEEVETRLSRRGGRGHAGG